VPVLAAGAAQTTPRTGAVHFAREASQEQKGVIRTLGCVLPRRVPWPPASSSTATLPSRNSCRPVLLQASASAELRCLNVSTVPADHCGLLCSRLATKSSTRGGATYLGRLQLVLQPPESVDFLGIVQYHCTQTNGAAPSKRGATSRGCCAATSLLACSSLCACCTSGSADTGAGCMAAQVQPLTAGPLCSWHCKGAWPSQRRACTQMAAPSELKRGVDLHGQTSDDCSPRSVVVHRYLEGCTCGQADHRTRTPEYSKILSISMRSASM
jgi:hypothetical protein